MTIRNVKLKNRAGEYLQPYTENLPTASTSTAGKVKLDSSPTSGSNNAITSGAVYTALSGKLSTTGTAAKATADASGNNIANTYLAKTGTAAKATADASGNNIANTYATKTELTTLQNSIPADSGLVHKTGSETIAGEKTFYSIVQKTDSTTSGSYIDFIQNINGARRGTMRTSYNSDGSYQVTFGCNGPDAAAPSGLIVKRTSSAITATAPTPAVSNNSTEIATTAYVNNKFKKVSALPSSPDANIYYFIPE